MEASFRLPVLLLILHGFLGLCVAETPGKLTGRIVAPGLASTIVRLHCGDGREMKSFVQADGSFEFMGVPSGSHLLQAFQLGLFFPEIKVDMSAKSGPLRATLVGQQKALVYPFPLVIKPLGELPYYEKRKPVDIWSLIKSPYGLMIGFSLFVIVVLPKLRVEPEELREIRGGGTAAAVGDREQQPRVAGR